MIKADSSLYCIEGNFCGLILTKKGLTHVKIEDVDNVKMCQVYGWLKEKFSIALLSRKNKMTAKFFASRVKFLIALFIFDNYVTWAFEFESEYRNNLFSCGISVPKQFGKQLLSFY